MKEDVSRGIIAWLLLVCAPGILFRALEPADAIPAQHRDVVVRGGCTDRGHGRLFARTELFFGKAKPDGSMITDEEFRVFLDDIITPRFPNGLTVLSGTGQFRGANGMILREGAVFVILFYPVEEKGSNALIEEIRDSYKRTFAQESVLRVDVESCVHF